MSLEEAGQAKSFLALESHVIDKHDVSYTNQIYFILHESPISFLVSSDGINPSCYSYLPTSI